MKINDRGGKIGGVFEQLTGEEKKREVQNGVLFQKTLQEVNGSKTEEAFLALRHKLEEQGARLKDKMDIHELRYYKKLLSEYLQQLLSGTYQFQKENLPDRRGRFRMFGMVKKINGQLEQLTEEVLKTEKDRVAIIQMLDDIRGMLIDLSL